MSMLVNSRILLIHLIPFPEWLAISRAIGIVLFSQESKDSCTGIKAAVLEGSIWMQKP